MALISLFPNCIFFPGKLPLNGFEVFLPLMYMVLAISLLNIPVANCFNPEPKLTNMISISIPQVTLKPVRKVLSLFFFSVSNISNQDSIRSPLELNRPLF